MNSFKGKLIETLAHWNPFSFCDLIVESGAISLVKKQQIQSRCKYICYFKPQYDQDKSPSIWMAFDPSVLAK